MQKKFEHKESRGLPGGPNEMFTYVTGVFDIYQAPSNIEGQGMFAGKPFKKGDLIGLAHSNGQPASQLGRMHNHDENSPTMISKKSGNDRFVFAAKDLQPGDELTTNYRMQPELEQPEDFQYGGSVMAPPRKGVRKNPDGSESTHLMATETFDGKNWFSFPTLFQNPDGTWIDMSDRPWQEAYEEANRRGEVIDFGTDKEAAIKFGEGSWKKQMGGSILPPAIRNMYSTEDTPIYGGIVGESTVTAPKYDGPQIRRMSEVEMAPINSNFSFIGADKSGGLSALRAIGKGVKGLLGLKGAADDVAKGFNYTKGYGNPYENFNLTDDLFSTPRLYPLAEMPAAEKQLANLKVFGKELDDLGFDANWIGPEHIRSHGKIGGRDVVEVALPGNSQKSTYFYRSRKGGGYRPYPAHMEIYPGEDWFIKDPDIDNFYGSNSLRQISNMLDSRYQKGGELPKAQLGGMFIGGPGLTAPISQAIGAPGSNIPYGFPVPDNNNFRITVDPSSAKTNEEYRQLANQANLDEAYNFAHNWMSSPRYREMLNKSGGTDWWTTSYDVAQERINNLNKIQSAPLYIEDDPNQYYTKEQLYSIGGYSKNETGNIYVDKFHGENDNTIYDHEMSHSIDRPITNSLPKDFVKYWGRGMGFEPRLIPDSDVNLITNLIDHSIPQEYSISTWEKYGDTPEEGTRNYYGTPTEVRARLNEIRRNLNDKGVDVFNNEITPDNYNKVLNTRALQDLKKIYSDEDILRLLNTISSVNDNVGTMPYAQKGGEAAKIAAQQATGYRPQATISQYEEPAWYEKAADYLASPMTSLGYLLRGEDLPDRIPINAENRNTYDMAFDIINPAAWAAYAESADKNLQEGNYLAAGFDAMGAIPIIPSSLSQGRTVIRAGSKSLPQYVKNVPVGNSDLLMTHAMPGLVPGIKGTKDGVLIAKAAGPRNNHMTLKKFLDAATGQEYYSFTESFIDNPMLAGRAFKMAEGLVPKGSILKQAPGGTLSQDSFNLMTRRLGDTRRFRDLTNYDADYINLNEFAKGRNRLGRDNFTFSQSELNALNAQYMDVFNNLGISEFRGLGSRQVPVMNLGNKGYNMFEIPGLQSIRDPRALQKYYNVSVPNITLQKLYQKGGEKTSWLDYANPFNWGVYTYDDAGTFGEAFAKARKEGQDQFMYYGDRYTTELAPTPEVKEEPKEEKLFYNKDILKGLSEEQIARRQSLLNAANTVASAQGDDDNLRRLLVMSAVMENTLGADPKAYGRDYTRSPMSIDDVAYNDLFNLREGAKGYTAQQKKNAAWLEGLGINTSDVDSLLRADDPMASMAVARLIYGRAPEALPSGDDPDALYNYYLKYYNKGGVDKYGGPEAHRKKFNDYYNQIYREFGGETDQLKIYKDYVYGVYDGTEMQSKAEKIYDKLNRVYYKEAKQSGTTVPNYILSKVMKQSDN